MKNEDFKKMKYRLIGKMFLSLVIGLACSFLFYFLIIDGLLNDALADFLANIDYRFYLFFVNYKYEITLVFFLCVTAFLNFRFISRFLDDINTIFYSLDHILEEDSDLITLSNSYSEIEEKLNHIKYTYMKSKQEAKEAETKKNDLIVYMAHDLKTPLTSVIGYLTLLEEEPEISKPLQEKYIGIALDKSKRLEDLINEFFEITRFNLQHITLNKQDLDLSFMLEQLVDEFYPLLSQKQLQTNLQIPYHIHVTADGDKLARVFDNLLKNAFHYSYKQTNIDICVIPNDYNVEIHFRNTGDVIPEHQLEQIFEKFYRLDSSRTSRTGGAGLGLAIAKQIIELHQGNISVNSSKEYTEFIVTLPIEK